MRSLSDKWGALRGSPFLYFITGGTYLANSYKHTYSQRSLIHSELVFLTGMENILDPRKVTVGDLKREASALKRALKKEVIKKQKLEKMMLEVHSLRHQLFTLRDENRETQKSLYHNGLTDTLRGDFARE